jgi:tryptophan synthase alpha chain
MNRLTELFRNKQENILNVYFTAGYPQLDDTMKVLEQLELSGADIVEIGIPFSDPIADGPTIQVSNHVALGNGMTLKLLLEQLKDVRKVVSVPIILMGYINPIMQYGMERFCEELKEIGIDGLILPDLPLREYTLHYEQLFKKCNLSNIFLITPQTSETRIKEIDSCSNSFIYMVSSASITGAKKGISSEQIAYFKRVNALNLTNQRLIGFGISDKESFDTASQYAAGAIIGSAFIDILGKSTDLTASISTFISSIKN